MRNIKLTIEYDGTDFKGWQIQKTTACRTVQGEIERVLRILFKSPTPVVGSGRTDAGVHALGQVANFLTDSAMPLEELRRALNANLPDDVVVTEVAEVPVAFHAQFSAKRKTYRYTILNRPSPPGLDRHFCLHVPYRLNLAAMQREARVLVGRHDFRSFMAMDVAKRAKLPLMDTTRRVYQVRLNRGREGYLTVEVTANGFLYRMVRNIVGTLLWAGSGRLPQGGVRQILRAKDRRRAGDTAPAHGLCLVAVDY